MFKILELFVQICLLEYLQQKPLLLSLWLFMLHIILRIKVTISEITLTQAKCRVENEQKVKNRYVSNVIIKHLINDDCLGVGEEGSGWYLCLVYLW